MESLFNYEPWPDDTRNHFPTWPLREPPEPNKDNAPSYSAHFLLLYFSMGLTAPHAGHLTPAQWQQAAAAPAQTIKGGQAFLL